MAKNVNFNVREHEERRLSYERAAAEGYSEATGYRETEKHTGPWLALVEMFEALAGEAASAEALSLELERLGGAVGELTITRTAYKKPEGEGEEGGELGTAENPAYTCNFTMQPAPLLTHPRYASISKADAQLIKEIENGTSMYTVVNYAGQDMELRVAVSRLSGPAEEAARYYWKGVTQYFAVQAEATARWKGGGNAYSIGTVCTPPGSVVNTPSGCNWLCTAKGKEQNGEEIWNTATFLLSAPGGWDPNLYGG